ncbi:Hypothetical predicted protein [Paramuricea clavata]|uniref:Uncharacterized protein n=1 Tax=Paramuricea clavata TaxID=317549 RepID=A0A7D9HN21_PARCT|nr:Hypothetical predicted protein [Paramuricea clavata]
MRCYSRDVFAQRYLNWFLLINVMKKDVIGMQFSNRKERNMRMTRRYPDLKVNDKVLLQQHKMCKTTTMYEHDPYEIVDVNGSQVTIKSGEGVCYKRSSSHVRKFEESDLPSGNEYIDNSEYSKEPNTNEQVIDNSLVVAEPRRSSRSTKGRAPERLDL